MNPLVLILAVLLAGVARAETSNRWTVVVSTAGGVRVDHDGKELGMMHPELFEAPWQHARLNVGSPGTAGSNGMHRGHIRAPSGALVNTELQVTGTRFEYRLTPKREMNLNSLNVTLTLPTPTLAGGRFWVDDKEFSFPAQLRAVTLWSAPTRKLRLAMADGGTLQFDFARPTHVLVQDDRKWGETFSVRIEPAKPGYPATLDFTLSSPDGLTLEEDGPVTIRADDQWRPLESSLDIEPGSALDFSNIVPRHAPAGKWGRIIVNRQGKFAFERRARTPLRFYGVNLCFSAQYLPHEDADRLADRLARLGYNAVRIHHYEGELVESGTGLKADKIDQLDYLFAALKRRGIYVTTDLFVSRPVPAAVIYEGATGLIGMDEYKMAVHVNDRAFEDYKAFARTFLGHENPYTRLRYADDPALAWLSLVNEDCPGNFTGQLKGRLREDWQRAWDRWRAERSLGSLPLQEVHGRSPNVVAFNEFLAEVERDFFVRTRRFLRDEVRCEALLTDVNAWTHPVQLQAVRNEFDYVDDHFYVDHPEFIGRPWSLPSRCPNTSPIAGGARGGSACAFTRVFGKPFTITEFNYAAPGRFRGVGGILTGTLGALQDWDGLWRFAYSHDRRNLIEPGAMRYFDIASDPLNQAAERASLCLFLRGDIQPARHAVAIAAVPDELRQNAGISCDKTPPWQGLAWLMRVGWAFDGRTMADSLRLPFNEGEPMKGGTGTNLVSTLRERRWLPAGNRTDFTRSRFQSDTGEVTLDGPADTLTLDTPLTAGGFAPAGRTIETKAARIDVLDTDATIWVSSLDGDPITSSQRLLLTHLTDLQDTDTRYGDRARQTLLAWGRLPHLVRAGRAVVTLRTSCARRAKVYALSVSGKRLAEVAATVGDGTLSIPLATAADGPARMLYEVSTEESPRAARLP